MTPYYFKRYGPNQFLSKILENQTNKKANIKNQPTVMFPLKRVKLHVNILLCFPGIINGMSKEQVTAQYESNLKGLETDLPCLFVCYVKNFFLL